MPYPILTLPYPFAKRLRQLLNPFELQELQKAAGHDVTTVLKPRTEVHNVPFIYLRRPSDDDHNANSSVQLYDDKKSFPKKDQYFIKCEYACFYNMSNTALEKLNSNQKIMLNANRLNFKDCQISNAFLKRLSKMVVNQPSQFDLRYCDQIDEDVNFSTILTIFPHVTYIALPKAYSGWFHDLASTGKKFHEVEVTNYNFETLFSFEPEELYDFVTQQYPDFSIRLYLQTNDVDVTMDKLKPFIDPRFDTKVNGDFKLVITVVLNNSTLWLRQFYYYKTMF